MNRPPTPTQKFLKKYKWPLGLATALILVVLTGLTVGPSIIYGNGLFRAWVQAQITDQSGGIFLFEDIGGGISSASLQKLKLDMDGNEINVRKVEADKMKATFAWLPLLKNRLEIKELEMEGGLIQIKLNGGDSSHIHLPVAPEFELENGTVEISQLGGWKLVLEKTDLEVEQKGDFDNYWLKGEFSAQKASIGCVWMTEVRCDFEIKEGVLHVLKFDALLPGKSKLAMTGSMPLNAPRSIDTRMEIKTQQIQSLLSGLEYSKSFDGSAHIQLTAKGVFSPSLKNLQGSGSAELDDIAPRVKLPLLPAFNDAAIFQRVKTLDDLKGKAEFSLEGPNIMIGTLDLKDSDMQLSGTARVGYDKSLSADMVMTGNETIDKEIPSVARGSYQHEEGKVIVPFKLANTTDEPELDLGNVVMKVLSNPVKVLNPLNIFN